MTMLVRIRCCENKTWLLVNLQPSAQVLVEILTYNITANPALALASSVAYFNPFSSAVEPHCRHFMWLLLEVVKTSHSKWGSIMGNTSFFENIEVTATWNPMPIECMLRLIPCRWFCVLLQIAQNCHLHDSLFLSVFSIVHTPSGKNKTKQTSIQLQ